MVVYNKTILDKDEVFDSLVAQTRKSQIKKFILTGIIIACAIFLLIYGYSQEDSNYISVGFIFLFFALFYLIMSIVSFVKAPKSVQAQNEAILSDSMTYDYTFKEQSFQVNITAGGKITKIPYKYENIKRVYEYDSRYEIKLIDNLILFVYKNGFTQEKALEFFIKNLSINKKKIINKIKEEKAA